MSYSALTPGTVALADAAAGFAGLPMGVGVVLGVLLFAFLGYAGWRLATRRRDELEHEAPAKELPAGDEAESAPRVDPLADRIETEAPVRITSDMSLREIKQAKAARLTGANRSEAVEEERERRKRGTVTLERESLPTDEAPSAPEVTPSPAPADAASQPDAEAPPADEPSMDAAAGQAPASPGAADAVPVEPDATKTPAEGGEAPAVAAPAPEPAPAPAPAPTAEPASAAAPTAAPARRPATTVTTGRTLEQGLARTKSGFIARLGSMFTRGSKLDDDVLEELEEVLFTADIGVETSQRLLSAVQRRYEAGEIEDGAKVWSLLRAEIGDILGGHSRQLTIGDARPFVLLMVGVNGAGKTTTIGKLAARFMAQGLKVEMVAADTFRAAAVDQLKEWGERVGCTVHAGEPESDPSSVAFDGITAAMSSGADVVLVDTAGRLQTKRPLMDELSKISRVMSKALDGAPHETVLVLDANTGQNAIAQARMFSEATPLTGLILTKLDGTAKGGVVIGISAELSVPIYFVGIGEAVEDLRPFRSEEFVDALF